MIGYGFYKKMLDVFGMEKLVSAHSVVFKAVESYKDQLIKSDKVRSRSWDEIETILEYEMPKIVHTILDGGYFKNSEKQQLSYVTGRLEKSVTPNL